MVCKSLLRRFLGSGASPATKVLLLPVGPCLLLLLALSGCVSKSSYRDVVAENERMTHQLALARAEARAARAQNELRQHQATEGLKVELASCRARVTATEEASERLAREAAAKGFYRGLAEFHQALQITGRTESDGWWIFADHYYTIQVSVAGHTLFAQRIETTDGEEPVVTALGTLAAVRELVPYRP